MKTRSLYIPALLGFAFSRPALAQVVLPGTPTNGAPTATGVPATGRPGTPIGSTDRSAGMPAGTVPLNATTPVGSTGSGTPLYPNGVPARNLDGGTQRADQPRTNGMPATSGSQPTKRLHKGRPRN